MYLHLAVIGQTGHIGSEHQEILAAVERRQLPAVGVLSGDAAATAGLTREHLAKAHDYILAYLVENPSALEPHAVLSP